MKYLNFYKNKKIPKDGVFEYFINTLQLSIKNWEYFVNWDKVKNNFDKFHVEISILNSLIGSKNMKKDFILLLTKYPEVIPVLPLLSAIRKGKERIRKYSESDNLECLDFNFSEQRLDSSELLKYYYFFDRMGLKKIFEDSTIKSLQDYYFGVEVGLDTNGRKNRGGDLMENLVEYLLKPLFLENNNLKYITQANSKRIKETFGVELQIGKLNRRFDLVIFNTKTKKLHLLELNFFNDGGSKLKSVCGEFQRLSQKLRKQGLPLIWISDGKGWHKDRAALEDAFDHNDYILNLNMIKEGIMSEILNK
jgi:hypothetical protein